MTALENTVGVDAPREAALREFLAVCEDVARACSLCVFDGCLAAPSRAADDGLERRLRVHLRCADSSAEAISVLSRDRDGYDSEGPARRAIIDCRRSCLRCVAAGHDPEATGETEPCATLAWRCAVAATTLLDRIPGTVPPASDAASI